MSIDITIEEMEALPAESYELFDIHSEILSSGSKKKKITESSSVL